MNQLKSAALSKRLARRLAKSFPALYRARGFARRIFKPELTSALSVCRNEEEKLVECGYITSEEIHRLNSGPQKQSILCGKPILITDSFWYLHSLKEIFAQEVYRFRSSSNAPYIIDCGSNIGLSVIYFKRLFPQSRILAFEPDSHICGLFRKNLNTFYIENVRVENKAIWREDTVLRFCAAGSLGGKLADDEVVQPSDANIVSVSSARLKNYLTEKVDFLKVDIEGPEVEVLEDCGQLLQNVGLLFVEYHSNPRREQELDQLLSILKRAGFRVYVKEAWNNLPLPFLRSDYAPCYDLQLNIFAYRTDTYSYS